MRGHFRRAYRRIDCEKRGSSPVGDCCWGGGGGPWRWFSTCFGGVGLGAGDRVRTADGSADILYDNGCSVRVEQHQVQVVLSATPQCDGAGQKDVRSDTISTGTLFIVGGLAAGGGVALALINTGKQAPASP